MEEFALKHPWITFFGGLLVLNSISWTAYAASRAAKGQTALGGLGKAK